MSEAWSCSLRIVVAVMLGVAVVLLGLAIGSPLGSGGTGRPDLDEDRPDDPEEEEKNQRDDQPLERSNDRGIVGPYDEHRGLTVTTSQKRGSWNLR